MAATHDPAAPPVDAPVAGDDLSALSWVQDELRRSLELAVKSLRRFVKEQAQRGDLDSVDPAVLHQARNQLHQSVGVLALVGLGPAVELLRAAEAALQRQGARPAAITPAVVDAVEQGGFALLDFIARRLAGKPVSTLALFPQYRALQELAGVTRIHPVDLWDLRWTWQPLALDEAVPARQPDQDTVGRIEADLLALMRGAPPSVAARMSERFAGLAVDAAARAGAGPQPRLATLWQLAAGFFEAQADGLLQPDPYSKRIGSRLLTQLRAGAQAEPAERLAHELLFFCSQAAPRASAAVGPRLGAVRRGYGLGVAAAVDYSQPGLGRVDPAWVAQARKRVAAAKEVWSAVAGGDLGRLEGLAEQFALVSDSLARLYPDGGLLGRALQVAVAHTAATGVEPPADLAMEVATALLYLDASLDDGDFDHPDSALRIQRLAQRLDAVRQARDPGTLELWMEELYRRVSDRQTMGSVVQELRASLSEVEQAIDQYFRDPSRRALLIPVPGQLSAMRGVLSVLGLDQASQAVLRMRDDVDALASTEVEPRGAIESGSFDRLADNLGALSFLIDMVSVQPQLAKSLFRFDPVTGVLSAVMAREDRPTGFDAFDLRATGPLHPLHPPRAAADTDALAVTLDFDRIVKQSRATQRAAAVADPALPYPPALPVLPAGSHGLPLLDLDAPAPEHAAPGDARSGDAAPAPAALPDLALDLTPAAAVGSLPGLAPQAAPGLALDLGGGLDADPEMREVFLAEAGEVLQGARAALDRLQHQPGDSAVFAELRRAFHTLKGSARMVGLDAFGTAAWACEQLWEARLAAPGAGHDPALQAFGLQACDRFAQWTRDLAAGAAGTPDPALLVQPAEALRRSLTAPAAAPEAVVAPAAVDLPQGSAARSAPETPEAPEAPEAPAAADIPGTAAAVEPAAEVLAPPPAPAFDLDLERAAAMPEPEPGLDLAPEPALDLAPEVDLALEPALDLDLEPGLDLELELEAADRAAPDDVGDLAARPPPAPIRSLLDRVPDLPLASDLDFLGFLDAPPPAAPPPAAASVEAVEPVEATEAPIAVAEATELDLALDFDTAFGILAPAPEAAPVPAEAKDAAAEAEAEAEADVLADTEADRQIGTLRISSALLAIYLNEADALSQRLGATLADWAQQPQQPVGEAAVALAHSLAGNSGAVGFVGLSQLARLLEQALERAHARGHGQGDEPALFDRAAQDIRRLLHLFAAGFLHAPDAGLLQALHQLAHGAPEPELRLADEAEAVDEAQEVETAEAAEAAEEGSAAAASVEPAGLAGPAELIELAELAEPAALAEPVGSEPAELAEPAEPEPAESEAAVTEAALADAPVLLPALPDLSDLPGLQELPDLSDLPDLADLADLAEPAVALPAGQEAGPAAVPAPQALPASVSAWAAAPDAALGQAALLPFEAAPLPQARPRPLATGFDEDIDQRDALDEELFPFFVEEAQELLPQLQARLRDWAARPGAPEPAAACMRSLHTLKGSARLAGAMRLGELAHRLESLIEHLAAAGAAAPAAAVEALLAHADTLDACFEALRQPAPADQPAAAVAPAALAAALPLRPADAAAAPVPAAPAPTAPPAAAAPSTPAAPAAVAAEGPRIDWQRFAAAPADAEPAAASAAGSATAGSVRVRVPLLDRLVNHAGEVSITRARIDADVVQLRSGLGDLGDNLERLRAQLREIELQAETQIGTRLEAARAAQDFDPLELDRFTRFQELTRMMAESVADVATVQRGLQRTLQTTEDALAQQARMARALQDDLLRTRMVEFEDLSERLYRVVRQAAKETGKVVRLDIAGGGIEIDRSVLDRMTPAFEHLLRNSVVHGIEAPALRSAAGKDATGSIAVLVTQVGNEVGVEVRDDGAGLDLAAIQARGLAMGLIAAGDAPDAAALANLIFAPGFSTATTVTDLAGRGVGMDVVRTDVNAMGGRIETASAPGQGTRFRLVLPLTTAVTQVVTLRCGAQSVAVPSTLVELVRRVPVAELAEAYASGSLADGARQLPFFWLASLLRGTPQGQVTGRTAPVVIIRSAAQRIALHVDEVLGNQEVVVKHLGPQLSRVPGLVGMTLLPSGLPALIYNPVALATLHGQAARAATLQALARPGGGIAGTAVAARPLAPLVLVVDDSLTVRRITQRLLEREGYRVTVAKDGLDGLDKLAAERPALLLTDIEMPRMDGFDLVRSVRADRRLADLPVIMITSRLAPRHRELAATLGVAEYLGKPYAEDALLALVARWARVPPAAGQADGKT